MPRPNLLIVAVALLFGLAILLAVVLTEKAAGGHLEPASTAAATPSTTWLETQPHLGDRFDDLLAAVARAKAAQRAKAKPAAQRVMVGEWPWDAVKNCESPGLGWDANTGNGYEGGLQFHPRTWSAYRPGDFPPRAHMATREQQILVAERVLAEQGWAAWPTCSRKLGLR